MEIDVSKISLRIRHPFKDLTPLAYALEMKIIREWRSGEGRKTVDGSLLAGFYRESYCALAFPEKIEKISSAIRFLAKKIDVFKMFDDDLMVKSIYCTIGAHGEVLGFQDLLLFGEIEVGLEID